MGNTDLSSGGNPPDKFAKAVDMGFEDNGTNPNGNFPISNLKRFWVTFEKPILFKRIEIARGKDPSSSELHDTYESQLNVCLYLDDIKITCTVDVS